MDEHKNQIIPIITGPTGSGKTSIALEIAQEFPIEIISADSRQIFKYLKIGTARPTPTEELICTFHLLDLVEPGDRYSAFKFIEDTDSAINDIISRDKIPIVVGGTGLYLRAISEGVMILDEQDGKQIRLELEADMEKFGSGVMYNRLVELDPVEADRIHPNNKIRLIRALEICQLTGNTKTELMEAGSYKKSEFSFEYFCLMPDREELYNAINQRVDKMMNLGLLDELKELISLGFKDALKRASVIGYSELIDFIDKKISHTEAVEMIKQNSRRYAKRQYTWLRHQVSGQQFQSGGELKKAVISHLKML